ncbi:hypothetical protein, partial [Salmonella sp. s54836]|uniref:hypothetical protein n=1 Tax=Salmonella sp. s54836 TaxID=3159673 RepID=UPI003980F5C2
AGFNRKKQDQYLTESTTAPKSTKAPPSYSDVSSSALRELKLREEEIARKEAELQDREHHIEAGMLGTVQRPNNFPPLPGFCPIKPCFFHDISVEIPPSQQFIVRGLFIWLIVHSVAYIANVFLGLLGFIAALVIGLEGNNYTSFIVNFGISIPLLLFF